jgi:hypothetical protein
MYGMRVFFFLIKFVMILLVTKEFKEFKFAFTLIQDYVSDLVNGAEWSVAQNKEKRSAQCSTKLGL